MPHPLVVPVGHALERGKLQARQEGLRRHPGRGPARRGRPRRRVTRQAGAAPQVRRDVAPGPVEPRAVPHAARVPEVRGRGEGHRRHHRHEVRRRLDRGEPLDGAGIRQAEGADLAVRPRLRRRPLDRVEAVGAFLLIGDEGPVRGVAPADVLHDDRVAARHRLLHDGAVGGAGLAVGRAVDERRIAPLARRTPDIGPQHDAVAHRHGGVAGEHARRLPGHRRGRPHHGERQGQARHHATHPDESRRHVMGTIRPPHRLRNRNQQGHAVGCVRPFPLRHGQDTLLIRPFRRPCAPPRHPSRRCAARLEVRRRVARRCRRRQCRRHAHRRARGAARRRGLGARRRHRPPAPRRRPRRARTSARIGGHGRDALAETSAGGGGAAAAWHRPPGRARRDRGVDWRVRRHLHRRRHPRPPLAAHPRSAGRAR